MEHERIAAISLIVVILGPTIFIFNPSYKTLEITYLVLQVATWTESYTGSNWQNAWTVFYWDGGLLGLLCRYVYSYVLFVSLFWEFY
jgi:choline-glycine betaine transporter